MKKNYAERKAAAWKKLADFIKKRGIESWAEMDAEHGRTAYMFVLKDGSVRYCMDATEEWLEDVGAKVKGEKR